MKLLASLALAFTASAAFAHGNVACPAMPKEEKKPQMELQKKLEGEGWKVRKVQNYNGCYEVYGFDASGKKAVDRATGNVVDAVQGSDLVVLATPVRSIELVMQEIAPHLAPGTVVTDTGSTKRQIVDWAAQHLPSTVSFVGGHPMTGRNTAGTRGPAAELFENAVYCVSSPPSGVL